MLSSSSSFSTAVTFASQEASFLINIHRFPDFCTVCFDKSVNHKYKKQSCQKNTKDDKNNFKIDGDKSWTTAAGNGSVF